MAPRAVFNRFGFNTLETYSSIIISDPQLRGLCYLKSLNHSPDSESFNNNNNSYYNDDFNLDIAIMS